MKLSQSLRFAMLLLVFGPVLVDANPLHAQTDLINPPTDSGVTSQILDIRKLLTEFDADDDGKLDSVERARVRLYIQNRNQQRTTEETSRQAWNDVVSRFDADGNGKLTSSERLRALNTIRELAGRRPQKPSIKDQLVSGLDTNGDGFVDPTERLRVQEQIESLRNSDAKSSNSSPDSNVQRKSLTRASLLERFDLNSDGVISPAEKAYAQQTLLLGQIPGETGPSN